MNMGRCSCNLLIMSCPHHSRKVPLTYCECGNPIYTTLKVMCTSCIEYEIELEQATYAQLSSYYVLFHYFHDTMLLVTMGHDYPTQEAILQLIPWENLGITLPTMYGRQDPDIESTLQAMRQQMEYHHG